MKKYELILEQIGFKKLDVPDMFIRDIYVLGETNMMDENGYVYNCHFTINIIKNNFLTTGILFSANMFIIYLSEIHCDEKSISTIKNYSTSRNINFDSEQSIIDNILKYKEFQKIIRQYKIKTLLESTVD